ncbi:hypothetical protein [Streptomyces sp. SCL15-4]|uniref:hypothetical protein n=1 Tax=Streptomyces sp. SCL15-4 TaxID=2967221 RepID=UPI0029668E86|nr:hypothetical protein [Streptomyces sp. SCL15-4]
MTGIGVEAGALAARSRALAVLRVRGRALGVALLPAGAAVILLTGGSTGHLVGPGWDAARWAVGALAVLVLPAAAGVGLVVARARPATSPTVPIPEESAPDLYRMVRDLADRLDVPAPSAIALTPDCDSWLEDRAHSAHGPPPRPAPGRPGGSRTPAPPVLVIGSPFLWWMRVGELRAVLAPVIAGTGPSAHPDIAAARRFVRGLDAAVAVASAPGRLPPVRGLCAAVGWVARLLLRGCREHATLMERGVAAAAAERAQAVDYGLRIVAQEQVGLAYAGWDRLLTRVALPAWRMGRWPSRLDAGVVAALTELSRRDRLAEGFASRLGERPACDLLEEPGTVDEAASLLAARLFHGGPAEPCTDWAPVDWQAYPEEVVDRTWRVDAARLHRALDSLGVRPAPAPGTRDPGGPTLARVLHHLTTASEADDDPAPRPGADGEPAQEATQPKPTSPEPQTAPQTADDSPEPQTAPQTADVRPRPQSGPQAPDGKPSAPSTAGEVPARTDTTPAPATTESPSEHAIPQTPANGHPAQAPNSGPPAQAAHCEPPPQGPVVEPPEPPLPQSVNDEDSSQGPSVLGDVTRSGGTGEREVDVEVEGEAEPGTPRSAALAALLTAELAREEARAQQAQKARKGAAGAHQGPDGAGWAPGDYGLPPFPLQPHRTARELLADHVTAMVCCAAVDTAGAVPALDWLDGPSLLLDGERAADLAPKVLTLIEDGDPRPLRDWLTAFGIRPEKPVRLV